jgi:hypothetical protein
VVVRRSDWSGNRVLSPAEAANARQYIRERQANADQWHRERAANADQWHRERAANAAEYIRERSPYYNNYPRDRYGLNWGYGHRGHGYYYGPPNMNYYYDYPGVQYYSTRSLIPSLLLNLGISQGASLGYSVQRALGERGYYQGPLDGDIGPGSRRAIAHFQADSGLEPTGMIDEDLLRALELQ